MTSLRALIVDDERLARCYLAELLRGTSRVEIVDSVATAAEARHALARDLEIDVWFVDIRLIDRQGDVSGLELVRSLATARKPPLLVLATATPEHALAAFDVGVIDYLVKPFTRPRVEQCVERLLGRVPRPVARGSLTTRLMARTATSQVFLPIATVLAFEAAERLTYVYHAEGRFLVDPSLAALGLEFGDAMVRAHRNWLIAVDHIRRLGRGRGGDLVVEVGIELSATLSIPVSRDRAAPVREALASRSIGSRR
jgi:DNA-binding LytR/AlgR family response regulator